nr:MAG TPA: hypothetical protein [Caudoviricetes sp.]
MKIRKSTDKENYKFRKQKSLDHKKRSRLKI